MRFAFKTANQYTTWADILAVWREADGIDVFESGWLFDHFYPIVSPQREADLTAACLDEVVAFAQAGLDLAIVYLALPHDPAVLAPLAEALAPLR